MNMDWQIFKKNIQYGKSTVRRAFSYWLVGKLVKSFWKAISQYTKSLQNVPLFKANIQFLGICPKEVTTNMDNNLQ